ncbi:ROK family protein [Jiangella asiatica]|uniref:ROK family protein n=1 Tax=Jiangella asiatica TaxID=2530372 RepID=A0A4R5DHQ1_9ACTN|nr:ROK family protein [Jiangella asiatica]
MATWGQAIDVHGAEPALLRHINRSQVLRLLRDAGEAMGISAIGQATRLSRPTVELALADLIARGTVLETGHTKGSARGGRPARSFQFAARSGCVVAVTVQRRQVSVDVFDLRQVALMRQVWPLADINEEPDPIGFVQAAVHQVLDERSLAPDLMRVVVVGVRGIVAEGGQVTVSGELPSFTGDAAHRDLQSRFSCPVIVENDANLAALAEHKQLGGPLDVVGLLIGEAVGCGLILNGELYRGAHGAAGEFFGPDAPWATTSQRIKTEVVARGSSLSEFFSLADGGNRMARELVVEYAVAIARLTRSLLLLDPPVVVIGGDIVHAGKTFLEPLRRELMPDLYHDTEIVYSELGSECHRVGAQQLAFNWFDDHLFRA